MKSLLNTFFTLCLLGWNQKVMAYMVGVGRGDCTGPPVGVNFVSIFSPVFIFFFHTKIPMHINQLVSIGETHEIVWFSMTKTDKDILDPYSYIFSVEKNDNNMKFL